MPILVPTLTHPDIQSALLDIAPGDIIWVKPGHYYEDPLLIDKSVRIYATGLGSSGAVLIHPATFSPWGTPQPLVQIRGNFLDVYLAHLHVHHGTIAVVRESTLSPPALLHLDAVHVLDSGASGGIIGYVRLVGGDVEVRRSAGDGIHIIGNAKMDSTVVEDCAGTGVIIENTVQSPPGWESNFDGTVTGNGRGGLVISDNAVYPPLLVHGYPFLVTGSYHANTLFGVSIEGASGTWLKHINASGNVGDGEFKGVGVYVRWATWVFIQSSNIAYNDIGLFAVVCRGLGQTFVQPRSCNFIENRDFHMGYATASGCASQLGQVIFQTHQGFHDNFCTGEKGCKVFPVGLQPPAPIAPQPQP